MNNYMTQYELEFKKYDYYVHFESRKGHINGGVFIAEVPTVGITADGPTIKGAIANATELVTRELTARSCTGKTIPDNDPNSKHQVFVTVKVARKVEVAN